MPEGTQQQGLGSTTGPIGYRSRLQDPGSYTGLNLDLPFGPESISNPPTGKSQPPINTSSASQKRLNEMTDREKFGLAGLMAQLDTGHPDHNPFMLGHDLTQLGLDLGRPE
jgi:hypothetical protein